MSPDSTTTERFTGALIVRGEAGYEHARVARIHHSRHPQRFPAAVLLAETENDVVEGVRLARERGWKVGVKSGGHSFPVWGLRDDGLLIDLFGLKDIHYDATTGIVSVTPAVTGGQELNPYLEQFGVFFPGGGCSSVGVGGFLLQGGIGWNFRG
ncbi:FAD-binding protein [Nocardia sp. NPDC051900]|uniref:FAD-binding protein n=1 Tax=Nocardia sp. NPDC051900 TaxID=3364326 RepID=UPI0037A28F6A